MKKLLILIMVLFYACAPAGNKYFLKVVKNKDVNFTANLKIAVIPENWDPTGISGFVPRALITEFLDMGFTVIERSQLEKILSESKPRQIDITKEEKPLPPPMRKSPVLDRDTIKKIGQSLGVDALLLTYIIPDYSMKTISRASIRLVDVETASVLFSITLINGVQYANVRPLKPLVNDIFLNIKRILSGYSKIIVENGNEVCILPDKEKKEIRKLWNKAMDYYNQGKFENAIEIWRKILIEYNPKHEPSQKMIRNSEERLRKLEKSIEEKKTQKQKASQTEKK